MHRLQLEAFGWDRIQLGPQLRPGRIVRFGTSVVGVSEAVNLVTHAGAVGSTHSDGDVAVCVVRSLDVGGLYSEGSTFWFRCGDLVRSGRVAMLLPQSTVEACSIGGGRVGALNTTPCSGATSIYFERSGGSRVLGPHKTRAALARVPPYGFEMFAQSFVFPDCVVFSFGRGAAHQQRTCGACPAHRG